MKIESTIALVFALPLFNMQVQGQRISEPSQAAFDVASVKRSAPSDVRVWQITGGPGTRSPGQFSARNAPLSALLLKAYGLQSYQLIAPASLGDDRFDVTANIPEGSTAEQVNLMLRNLLIERFSIVAHTETRDLTSYELVVSKGGLKMKDAEKALGGTPSNDQSAVVPGPPKVSIGPDGVPVLPPGKPMWISLGEGRNTRIVARMQTTSALADLLALAVSRPVVDKTGLTGTYDFTLLYSPDTARTPPPLPPPAPDAGISQSEGIDGVRDPVPELTKAVGAQLGLRLEPIRSPGIVLLVERYSRVLKED